MLPLLARFVRPYHITKGELPLIDRTEDSLHTCRYTESTLGRLDVSVNGVLADVQELTDDPIAFSLRYELEALSLSIPEGALAHARSEGRVMRDSVVEVQAYQVNHLIRFWCHTWRVSHD
jgi:hypothetical protein